MTGLTKPSDVAPVPQRDAGGDNEVPRDHLGRPKIIVKCVNCDGTGKIPSLKVEGRLNKCMKCSGQGHKLTSYTRTTTYIDVIEDKSNLMAWKGRMVLAGVSIDRTLLDGVDDRFVTVGDPSADPEDVKKAKDWLNRRAESAAKTAGAEDKADKGTFLHGLSELVDQGLPLPEGIDFMDHIDMMAYEQATVDFEVVHMEKLVVQDTFKIGGTPDRASRWIGEGELVAPDGAVIEDDELLITDLKTGTVEYGALKMAMQLAIYAHSDLYDPESGDRMPIENINTKWGVIMNLPAGTGECTLYWADLTMGWQAVAIAREIRALRSAGKGALKPFRSVSASV